MLKDIWKEVSVWGKIRLIFVVLFYVGIQVLPIIGLFLFQDIIPLILSCICILSFLVADALFVLLEIEYLKK